mmetsp:Transcript_5768/g.9430  ORF Transcript_5768/g.9430 Transcript_5768/m.9430 type:complete len:250 (-) Transcript_5768:37-786(-)|eukprot:scaffold7923_cov154-Skeletonema_menzelii.AAC.1
MKGHTSENETVVTSIEHPPHVHRLLRLIREGTYSSSSTVGTILIRFLGMCRLLSLGTVLPAGFLVGVSYRSELIDGLLVHFIQGWEVLAMELLSEEVIAAARSTGHSIGAVFMTQLACQGLEQNVLSPTFDVKTTIASQAYRSSSSWIAVHHRDVNDLSLETIRNVPTFTPSLGRRNATYFKANRVGWFVDGGRRKLTQSAAFKAIGGKPQTTYRLLAGMKERYLRLNVQEVRTTIRSNGREKTVICRR